MTNGRREIEVNKAHEFLFRFYENGLQETPDSATLTLYDNRGNEVASDVCIIDINGDTTWTLAAEDNDEQARNFKIAIERNVGGETRYYYELFDVVAVPLINLCNDEVLFDKISELRKTMYESVYKTTEEGGDNELRCLRLTSDTRDYSGGYLQILFTGGAVHNARVVDYEQTSGSCIFAPAYTEVIAANTTFRIRPSFQRKIDDAFERCVKRDIRNKIGIASRLIDGNLVVNLTAYKTLEGYCLSQIEADGDKWSLRYDAYKQSYLDEFSRLQEAVDADDDGNISDSEDAQKTGTMIMEAVR